MGKVTIKDKDGLDVELSTNKVGNEVHLTKQGSEKKVILYTADPQRIKEFQELVVPEEKEKSILGSVLFQMLNNIRK